MGPSRKCAVLTTALLFTGMAHSHAGETGIPLDRAELAALSGGTAGGDHDFHTIQSLDAVNAGNSVRGDTIDSGMITIQDNGLSGFAGIGNFVINSGHNNNLQGTISVTVIVPEVRP